MWFADNHKDNREMPETIDWWGFRCVRYTCEELSYWYFDEEGEPHHHGLPWSGAIYARTKANLTVRRTSRDTSERMYACVELIQRRGVMCVRTYIRMLVLILPKGEQHRAVPTHTHG